MVNDTFESDCLHTSDPPFSLTIALASADKSPGLSQGLLLTIISNYGVISPRIAMFLPSTELPQLQLSNETTLVAFGPAVFSEGRKHHPDTQLLLAPDH